MIVRQHIPAFVDVERPSDVHVASLEGLLAVPFVAQWSDDSLRRFEVSRSTPGRPLLMAQMKDGDFCVIAYLYPEGDEAILNDLPEWVEDTDALLADVERLRGLLSRAGGKP